MSNIAGAFFYVCVIDICLKNGMSDQRKIAVVFNSGQKNSFISGQSQLLSEIDSDRSQPKSGNDIYIWPSLRKTCFGQKIVLIYGRHLQKHTWRVICKWSFGPLQRAGVHWRSSRSLF